MQKEITKKEARDKYGIIALKRHDLKYFLQDNGNVVDSAGDIRYIARQSITIPMTEQDCEEVMQGEEFHWTFPDQNGVDINVIIRAETDEDNE